MAFDDLGSPRDSAGEIDSTCPACGQYVRLLSLDQPCIPYYPWHLRNVDAVEAYVATLPAEACEWLLALYVDEHLNLMSVETVGVGDLQSVRLNFGRLIHRAHAQRAAGFFLVHNHPSGDPTPSVDDIRVTARLAHVSKECGVPLIRHYVVAADGMLTVGEW